MGCGEARTKEFGGCPWRGDPGDPNWRPPLDADLLGSRLLGVKGLLTAENEYHRDAEVTHFIARRDGRAVGTVSAAVNRRFNEHYHATIGFFGFFEVEDDAEAAGALLAAARDWLRERGMTVMRGDRNRVVWGKSVDLGGRRIMNTEREILLVGHSHLCCTLGR